MVSELVIRAFVRQIQNRLSSVQDHPMLKPLIALVLSATLATCTKRDPRYPPCQALYYVLKHEPVFWPPSNRVHLCDALSWDNETAQLTYIHELYNPDPVTVFSHGSQVGNIRGDPLNVGSYVMMKYTWEVEGIPGIAPELPPEAVCHVALDDKHKWRWVAWGTDEGQVARIVCPKGPPKRPKRPKR